MALIGVRFSDEEYDCIKRLSKADARSISSFVRLATLSKINESHSASQE